MNVQIRIANETDVPIITEIYNQAVELRSATADLAPVSVESRRVWLSAHLPDRYPVFVAESASGACDAVVGWCSLSAHRPGRLALRYTAEISYYVHGDFRGMGFGSHLVSHALAQCPRLGIKNLFAILLDINVASIGILEKFGFQKWGHLPDIAELDGQECGQFIYGRRVV